MKTKMMMTRYTRWPPICHLLLAGNLIRVLVRACALVCRRVQLGARDALLHVSALCACPSFFRARGNSCLSQAPRMCCLYAAGQGCLPSFGRKSADAGEYAKSSRVLRRVARCAHLPYTCPRARKPGGYVRTLTCPRAQVRARDVGRARGPLFPRVALCLASGGHTHTQHRIDPGAPLLGAVCVCSRSPQGSGPRSAKNKQNSASAR